MSDSSRSTLLPLLAAVLLLLPALAQARFILTDANFDNRTVGDSLQRRGALYGEPVSGPYDRERETVVSDGFNDMAIELLDTQILGPTEMYWNLRDGMQIQGGQLTCRLEFTPQVSGDFSIALRAADQLTDLVAIDVVAGANGCYWRDADSPSGTYFTAVNPGDTYEILLELNLNTDRWDLWWMDFHIVSNEPLGLAGEALSYLVVGHPDDGNASGAFVYDVISLDWRPDDTVPDLMIANFNDKPAGQPLDVRGAFYGEPVSITTYAEPTVEVGLPLGNKAMVLSDISETDPANVRFEFYNGVEPTDQPVSISFAIAFDQLQNSFVAVREQGGSHHDFLHLVFREDGTLRVYDAASSIIYVVSTNYYANFAHVVEMAFEPELDVYSVWLDGARIVHRRSHGITEREVGRISFSCDADADLDGTLFVDRIRAHTLGVPVAAPEPLPATPARLLGAVPNPFNPSTRVAFSLPAPSVVDLAVYDARGGCVRRLVRGEAFPAGRHAIRWDGTDDSGRHVGSGVYLLRLLAGGEQQTRKAVLLK